MKEIESLKAFHKIWLLKKEPVSELSLGKEMSMT